jgi:hypothetical protein
VAHTQSLSFLCPLTRLEPPLNNKVRTPFAQLNEQALVGCTRIKISNLFGQSQPQPRTKQYSSDARTIQGLFSEYIPGLSAPYFSKKKKKKESHKV